MGTLNYLIVAIRRDVRTFRADARALANVGFYLWRRSAGLRRELRVAWVRAASGER